VGRSAGRRRGNVRSRRAWCSERGFTLIELLIVLGILPLLIGAIAVVTISSYRNQATTSTRLVTSHDAQISAAYFVRDVQSAIHVSTQTSPATCAVSGANTQLLGLAWTTASGQTVNVSYGLSATGSPTRLVRRICVGAASAVTTNVSVELFDDLSTPTISNGCGGASSCAISSGQPIASVTVNCADGSTTCANGGPVTTYPTGSSPGVRNVRLFVDEGTGKYQFTLIAAPRNQNSAPSATPPGSSNPPLVLLGSGTGVLSCAGSGHSPLTVDGTAAVNSSSSGSISLGGNDTLQASEVYTQSTNPVSPASAYSGPYVVGPPITDPYANLADPDTTGLTTYGSGTLSGPGVYTSAVTVTSATTMSPGTYIFEQGLSISGNGTVTGAGISIFIGVPGSTATQSATLMVSGKGAVDISPMTTGTYAGVLIFQSRYDSSTLQISGNGSASTYGGAIYAPDATVDMSGNGGVATGSIVSNSLSCGGNGGASIGGPFPQVTFPAAAGSYTATGNGPASWSGEDPCSPDQSICGAAVDLSGTITTIQMSLEEQSSSKCWDGTFTGGTANFTASCQKYITVTSSGSAWYQAWQEGYFPKGSYTLTILATDDALFNRTTSVSFSVT
jgi:prepilin-type N-terminal cleavage/methylation domain-containing protein